MNNIILLLNDFPKLSVFKTIDVITGLTQLHSQSYTDLIKLHEREKITTNHICINSKILSRNFLSTQLYEGCLNNMLGFNNIVVMLDGIITNGTSLIENLNNYINISFSEFTSQKMTIEHLIIRLYCKYGFKKTITMLEGQFSIVLIDRRIDDLIETSTNFRKSSSHIDTKSTSRLSKKYSLDSINKSLDYLESLPHVKEQAYSRTRELIKGGEKHEYEKDCEEIIGSKIYVSREKSGITTLFIIIATIDNNESFLITNNYSSVIKIERELTDMDYKFITIKVNAGCYTVLTHGHLVFSKWKINNMNYPYYIKSYIELYDGITENYVKMYGSVLYDCITDSVKYTLNCEKNIGCLITNTIESRIIFENLKKYYTNKSICVPFYVYSLCFEESTTPNKPSYVPLLYNENESKHTYIHTNLNIPSIRSIDMKPLIKDIINNMIHLYPCDFMEKFLNDCIIKRLLSNEPSIFENSSLDIKTNKYITPIDTDTVLPINNKRRLYINTEQIYNPEYYLNILKTNIGYFYLAEHISRNMPNVKTLFLPSGSRFIFNSYIKPPVLFDKNTYNVYCKSYKDNIDSNEGLRMNLYLYSKNIRCVCPYLDKRITNLFFSLSKEVRYSILNTIGIVGNTLLMFMEHENICNGKLINVKTPDNFFIDNKSIYVKCKIQSNIIDDIIY